MVTNVARSSARPKHRARVSPSWGQRGSGSGGRPGSRTGHRARGPRVGCLDLEQDAARPPAGRRRGQRGGDAAPSPCRAGVDLDGRDRTRPRRPATGPRRRATSAEQQRARDRRQVRTAVAVTGQPGRVGFGVQPHERVRGGGAGRSAIAAVITKAGLERSTQDRSARKISSWWVRAVAPGAGPAAPRSSAAGRGWRYQPVTAATARGQRAGQDRRAGAPSWRGR